MLGHVLVGQPTVILRVPAQSKRKVNGWICAPRTTDHDPANVIFNKICNTCNVCNVCNFLCGRIVFELVKIRNVRNLMQTYRFRFNFRFVTVIILSKMVLPDGQIFSPFINADIRTLLFSADVLRKCALLAMHLIAEEGRDADGSHAPGLGDEWKKGCSKSQMWESRNEAWSEDESVVFQCLSRSNAVNNALHVIGL